MIVGGGVAGVCCAEEFCRLSPDARVTLVSISSESTEVAESTKLTEHLDEITLKLRSLYSLPKRIHSKNFHVIRGAASSLDTSRKVLQLSDGRILPYDQLCICSGARPKVVSCHERIIALRDHDSVQDLRQRLSTARRIMVMGNGGIALEVVHALRGVDTVWAIRNSHIGDAFFDVDAAAFLMKELQKADTTPLPQSKAKVLPSEGSKAENMQRTDTKSLGSGAAGHKRSANDSLNKASDDSQKQDVRQVKHGPGMAVGPEWIQLLQQSRGASGGRLVIEHTCEFESTIDEGPNNEGSGDDSWPLYIRLSNGSVYGVDFAVSATGVEPATEWLPPSIRRHPRDGGIEVDEILETSCASVFAAGDVCCASALERASAQWFQMRLWTQARTMGKYAALCMFNATAPPEKVLLSGLYFELFTHVTRFCGKKVILLGLYNGQRLDDEPSSDIITYSRASEGADSTFVRVLLLRGRMQGAVLIGNTDLEELYENLILNSLDVSQYGPDLVDPDAELHDVFD